MYTVFIFFIVLSILVIIHELGHFVVAKLNGIKVEEFGFGLPPRAFGIQYGETLYSLNWLPFGGFVKVFGEEDAELQGKKMTPALRKRSFAHKKPWQKASVLTAGVIMNFILGWFILSYFFVKGVPTPTDIVTIESVAPNTPAAEVGLQAGDVLKSMTQGSQTIVIDEPEDMSEGTKKFAGTEVILVISRNEQPQTINVIPRENPPPDEGSLGIAITNLQIKKHSLVEAPVLGFRRSVELTGLITKETVLALTRFVTFQDQEAEIGGPIKIAIISGEAARAGLDDLLLLIAGLSFSLAVINILPFPALDGGRLVFVIYEWITKKKVNPTLESRLNLIGIIVLLGLMVLISINDIRNLL